MNTQEIMMEVAKIQKEINLKSLQILRKHLQGNKSSQFFQLELLELVKDLEKNIPLTAKRCNEMVELMMKDLETSNHKPVIKTTSAAKKVICAAGVNLKTQEKEAHLQSNKTEGLFEDSASCFPTGAFEKMVEMFEQQTELARAQMNFPAPYSHLTNKVPILKPDYTPPGLYIWNKMQQSESFEDQSSNPQFFGFAFNPAEQQPSPVYDQQEKPLTCAEQLARATMERWHVEQLRQVQFGRQPLAPSSLKNNGAVQDGHRYPHQVLPCYYNPSNMYDVRNPASHYYQKEQTMNDASYTQERPSTHNPLYPQPKPLYSTELGSFTTIDDMEQYVIEQNRLISKAAAARMLDFQTYQLDEIIHPLQKAYDAEFPKPVLFGSKTVRFHIGDILKYIKSRH